MSPELIEELKSDLEVSQNVVRIVVKELIATQQELKELKVKVTPASEPSITRLPEDSTPLEARKSPSISPSPDDEVDELDEEAYLMPEDVRGVPKGSEDSRVTIDKLQTDLASLVEERGKLMEDRDGLQEKCNEAQEKLQKLRKYREKCKVLKEKIDSMEVAHHEAVSKLEAERVGAIAAREELSKNVSKQNARGGQNGFDLKKFVKDTDDPKAYAHIEEIVTFTYERYDFHVPKHTRSHLANSIPLTTHDDRGSWFDASGSHFLVIDPEFTYQPHPKDATDLFCRSEQEAKGVKTDVFCFSSRDGLWRYHGIFLCIGAQAITHKEAKTLLRLTPKTFGALERRSVDCYKGPTQQESDMVRQMYMHGMLKYMCTAFRRVGYNESLLNALNTPAGLPVPIPIPGEKRKIPPSVGLSHAKRMKQWMTL